VPLLVRSRPDSNEGDSLLEFVNGARNQVHVLRDLWQRTGESVSVKSVTGRSQGTSTAGNLVTPGASIGEEDLFRKVAIREVRMKRDELTQLRYTQVRTHAQRLVHESSSQEAQLAMPVGAEHLQLPGYLMLCLLLICQLRLVLGFREV
jgi:hypothetical protein